MAEIFGGGEGVLAGLEANRMMGEIAQQPAELQIKQAQAQQAQMQVQQKQRQIQLLHDAMLGQSGTPGGVDQFEKAAGAYMEAGNPDEALKVMQGAYLMRQRGAKANLALTDELVKRGKATQQTLDLGARLFAGVHDTESQRAAARVWKQMAPDAGPLADMMEQQEYSPELIEQAQKWGIAMKDQAGLAIKNAEEQSKDRNRKSLEDHRKVTESIQQQRASNDTARTQRIVKQGGTPVTSPNGKEQEMAMRIIRDEFPDADANTLMQGSGAVAAMAKAMVKENPGLDFDQALRRAFEKSKSDGDWAPVARTGGVNLPFFGNVGGKTQSKFTRGDGTSAQKMIKTPKGEMSQQSVIDAVLKANPGKKADDPDIQAILKRYGVTSGGD